MIRTILPLAALAATLLSPTLGNAQGFQGPIEHKHIYPEVEAAQGDLRAALKQARREHKRVLVDFGGDWCGDCQVLDIYMHQPENLELLESNFVLVHVNVGRIDQNLDLGDKLHVTLKKGVPALAVLDSSGKSLYGQNGEFEDMRHMDPASVHQFLEQWKVRG
jgi:thioredoxin 1